MSSVNLWKQPQTFWPHAVPKAGVHGGFCENCGKLDAPRVAGEVGHRFIQFATQILRIFFNSSPQDLAEGRGRSSKREDDA